MKIQKIINQVAEKEPLFYSLLSELEPIENKSIPTLGTDGEQLIYNPEFLESLTEKEQCAVVLHEALHCAFQHLWRKGSREDDRWNRAADYAINNTVNESFPLPKDSLVDSKYYGMTAEEIYDRLPKGSGGDKGKSKGGGKGDGNQQQGWCDKDQWAKKESEKRSLADKILGRKKSKSKEEQEQLARKWKDILEGQMVRNYGSMPESIKRIIEKTYYVPVIDWASLVSSLLSDDVNDYTFAIPDRRFLEEDYILPSDYSQDKLKDVVFAYDTSGSISEDDLKAFYGETQNLMKNFTNLQGWAAICDADLHGFHELDTQKGFADFGFVGGGGTDFRPVFNKIKNKNMRPKALFYFTDTEGSFPAHSPEYPVFWLVRTHVGQSWAPKVPFGSLIQFLAK